MFSLNKKRNIIIILSLIVVTLFASGFYLYYYNEKNQANNSSLENKDNDTKDEKNELAEEPIEETEAPEAKEETFTKITLTAAGDIMFHGDQIKSAHQDQGTYDFKPMFADVKPILSAADLTIANFETTISGKEPYVGYPLFNSPDEVVDAIKDAGIDLLTTANNHSLDSGDSGLRRTVDVLNENGLDTIGTYSSKPDSRVLVKEVKGIKIAFLAYTESTNGLGAKYSDEDLKSMLNLMDKDLIVEDIKEAKSLNADFIISFMHWGVEYAAEPNDKQVEFAELMAEEGVDLILGSHPHVIQKSDLIETEDKETYVIYSMGNFISNQRRESLGNDFARTEDGIIINFEIEQNDLTKETKLVDLEYIPTWVYRSERKNTSLYDYRILPIESFLINDEISSSYKKRMEKSLEATSSKMIDLP